MAKFVESSKNVKISGGFEIAASYASIEKSCPDSCKLKNAGCYAQTSYVGMINQKLTKSAKKKRMKPLDVAKKEARLIDESFDGGPIPQKGPKGGIDLRLHVSGDFSSKTAAKILGEAASRYKARQGGAVYTYSHNWRKISRDSFGKDLSVIASVDNIIEAKQAIAKGFATAIVVESFPNEDKAFEIEGIKFIPCVQQTKDIPCVKCRLCFDDKKLVDIKANIAFASHGILKNKINKRLLKVIK